MMNRKGPWEGYRRQAKRCFARCFLLAFFCAHTFIKRERDVWVRGSKRITLKHITKCSAVIFHHWKHTSILNSESKTHSYGTEHVLVRKKRYHYYSKSRIRWLKKSDTTILPSLRTAAEIGVLNSPIPPPCFPNLATNFPLRSNTRIL